MRRHWYNSPVLVGCLFLVLAVLLVGGLYLVFSGRLGGSVTQGVATPSPAVSSQTQATPTPFLRRLDQATPGPGGGTATPRPTRAPTRAPAALPTAAPTVIAAGVQGTNLVLFTEPGAKRQPILDVLNSAQKSIDMVMYLLTDDQITEALIAAQKRGVKVRAMIEPHPFGGGGGSKEDADKLRAAGIQVKESNPTFRFTHQKSFIVDRNKALILSMNMTNASFTRNREYGVLDTDQARVAEIQAVFEADWNRTKPTLSQPDLVWSPVSSRQKITDLLKSAQRTVMLQTEVMQDPAIIRLLLDLQKRGVQVRVIMSPPDEGSSTDKGLAQLRQGGVAVHLVKSPYIHGKMIVVDGARGWIGSENISDTSLDNNRELGILLYDPSMMRNLQTAFEADWQND